jgi:dTMP kinase
MSDTSQTGFFITFEGSEGCGKTTQIDLLVNTLATAGITPVLVREPGGTPIGESIRHLLQHSMESHKMTAETELLLFAASRAQLVRQTILPALEAGAIVISDRFLDSTTVYQGVARRISEGIVESINQFAAGRDFQTSPSCSTWIRTRPIRGSLAVLPRNATEWRNSLQSSTKRFGAAILSWRAPVRTEFASWTRQDPKRKCQRDSSHLRLHAIFKRIGL